MGIIISKFRKKTSTFDVLTKLQNEIVSIEEFQTRTQQTQRKIVFRFLLLGILIYCLVVVLGYFYFSQISQNHKLLWAIPLIAIPFVIWFIKIILTWYYNRKIIKNGKKLVSLREKKKKILENVAETETYKVAKQILDKFDNENKKPVVATPLSQLQISKTTPFVPLQSKMYESVLRQRTLTAQNTLSGRLSFGGAPQTPTTPQHQMHLPALRERSINVIATPNRSMVVSSPKSSPVLPRTMLPTTQSVLDKMVYYLVGDGPSNRFALICQNCSRHNGMALKEEFDYLAFYCGYCNFFNPARKTKPNAPKFGPLASTPMQITSGTAESSDSERTSGNDSDSESRPIIEEPRSDSPDTARTSEYERVSDLELPDEDDLPHGHATANFNNDLKANADASDT
ncbi:unnamed protein product [Ceutorhynchus assimilis]|uniref:Endoplasmic reticulum junction formation protein lunapark n=1 Tax=Ceutorhynchus assimilis TaxID=467358 RepID=A0A9N9MJU3_9CUCU|nr:unnamed protein product [Ceutorhynchus assimilis]